MGLIYMCVIGATFVLVRGEYFETVPSKDAVSRRMSCWDSAAPCLLLMTILGVAGHREYCSKRRPKGRGRHGVSS